MHWLTEREAAVAAGEEPPRPPLGRDLAGLQLKRRKRDGSPVTTGEAGTTWGWDEEDYLAQLVATYYRSTGSGPPGKDRKDVIKKFMMRYPNPRERQVDSKIFRMWEDYK